MPSCLNEFMKQHSTKRELLDAFKPRSRSIHFSFAQSDVVDTIESILSLTRNSIEQHQQAIRIIQDKSKTYLDFPHTGGLSGSSNRIAILLSLLRTIHESIKTNKIRTIRDIYYSNVELYKNQRKVEYWLSIITKCFGLNSKNCLNIVPAQKGLCYTPIEFSILTNGKETRIPGNVSSLIPYMNQGSTVRIRGDSTMKLRLIVLEKEAVYNKLVDSSNVTLPKNTIIITGKGYPDFLTRLLLNRLQHEILSCIVDWEIYTDADPHGIDIALKYMENDTHPHYKCEKLVYKGVLLSQLIRIKNVQFLPLTHRDVSLASRLLDKCTTTTSKRSCKLITELQRQLFFQKKAEMNSIGKEQYSCQ